MLQLRFKETKRGHLPGNPLSGCHRNHHFRSGPGPRSAGRPSGQPRGVSVGPGASALPRSGFFQAAWKQREDPEEDKMGKRLDTSVAMATATSGPFLFMTRPNSSRGKFDSHSLHLLLFLVESLKRAGWRYPRTFPFRTPVRHFCWAEARKDTAGDSEGEAGFPEATAGRETECAGSGSPFPLAPRLLVCQKNN